MDQCTFNEYIESVILGKSSPEALEGHLGDVKMTVVCKAPINDRYIGEIPAESQLRIDVVYGGDFKLRTVYNSMFPLCRYIESLDDINVEVLKQKILQYKSEWLLL